MGVCKELTFTSEGGFFVCPWGVWAFQGLFAFSWAAFCPLGCVGILQAYTQSTPTEPMGIQAKVTWPCAVFSTCNGE